MKLIFLHGPPASGKYTIACELERLTGARNFHNHLTINVAKSLYEFGSDSFWSLLSKLRTDCLKHASSHDIDSVIMTSCYSHPDDLPIVDDLKGVVREVRGKFLPVYLQCQQADLEERVTLQSRVDMKKIRSISGLHEFQDRYNCVAVPEDNCVSIETSGKSAELCAKEIIDLLKLTGNN